MSHEVVYDYSNDLIGSIGHQFNMDCQKNNIKIQIFNLCKTKKYPFLKYTIFDYT